MWKWNNLKVNSNAQKWYQLRGDSYALITSCVFPVANRLRECEQQYFRVSWCEYLIYQTCSCGVWVSFCHNCSKLRPPFSRIWNSFLALPLLIRQAGETCKLPLQLCGDTLVLCLFALWSPLQPSSLSRSLGVKAASPSIWLASCSQTPAQKWREGGKGRNLSGLSRALWGAASSPSSLHSFISVLLRTAA